MFSGNFTAHLDYLQRARVPSEAGADLNPIDVSNPQREQLQTPTEDEKMLIGSMSARVQDLLRVLFAYGQGLGNTNRQSLSGGIAVVNNNISLSYVVSQPYLANNRTHQAINLSMELNL